MTAYYNEIDPYCVQWLKNLIAEGLIADGHVDDRSIQDVTPNDLRGYIQCHFFAGLGGWPAALRRSKVWPDHRPVWTGSCPCQPFSVAGKQGGFADERHLWPQWRYLIAQCRPATILGEQVASASQWLKLVRGDLEALDYAVGAMPVEAASAGAYHLRDRYWFVAHAAGRGDKRPNQPAGVFPLSDEPSGNVGHSSSSARLAVGPLAEEQRGDVRLERTTVSEAGDRGWILADSASKRFDGREDSAGARGRGGAGGNNDIEWVFGADGKQRPVKPGVRILAHGIPQRVAKLRALGNAIDLRPATAFIQAASEIIA